MITLLYVYCTVCVLYVNFLVVILALCEYFSSSFSFDFIVCNRFCVSFQTLLRCRWRKH